MLQIAVLNRLFCDPGSYLQSRNFGINILSWLYATSDIITTDEMQQQISKELRKDIRIDTVNAVCTYDGQSLLQIRIDVYPVDTTMNFALSLAQVRSQQYFSVEFGMAA